jgi:DNA primase
MMIKPPAVKRYPIEQAAAELGVPLVGRRASCFNSGGHKLGRDTHPSLTLLPDANRFKCYSCGISGDVIDFVRGVRGGSFCEAVAWLEQRAGSRPVGAVPAPCASPQSFLPDEAAREVYTALYQDCCKMYQEMPGGAYLHNRGIDLEVANRCGVAEVDDPAELWGLLMARFGQERLQAAGLVSRSGRFLFGGHTLLFAYFDDGWPVYLQARDVTGQAKCKELSLAGLRSPVPYNADILRQPLDHVSICEGCVDTLSAIQLGYPAVGIPGVTGFRAEWFERFQHVGQVHILFDNDDAGQKHAAELRTQFRRCNIQADVLCPTGAKDINDLLQQRSKTS